MKKILLIAFLFATVSAHAQFHFGFKGGVSITNLDYSKLNPSKVNYTGWHIGPTAEFTFPLLGLGIDAAAFYATSGDETKSFEIPVRLKYSFGIGRTLGGFIAVGPQFTYLFNDDYVNDFATSLNTAVGIKLFKHLQAEVGYLFPIGPTMKPFMIGGSPDKVKRKGWQLSLAYFF